MKGGYMFFRRITLTLEKRTNKANHRVFHVKWFTCIMLALAFIGLLAGCCQPPRLSSVPVVLAPQNRDWWCWAATTEMISDYYGHRIDQCKSANYIHGTPPDCCTGCSGNCPCWGSAWSVSITDIKNNWTHWNFEYKYIPSSLSWDDVKETVSTTPFCLKSPIQAIWWWTGLGGHVVTIYGYAEIGDEKYISYFDPGPPDCEKKNGQCSPVPGGEDVVVTYDAFLSDGTHTWGGSFYNFKYIGQ